MFNNRVFISSDFLAPPWARKYFLVGAQVSSLKLTLQRYDAAIAVLESCRKKKKIFFKSGHECHVSRVSLSNSECESPHNNI